MYFTKRGKNEKQEIVSVLYDLYKITGFRMSLHDVNFVEIAAYPPEKLKICAAIHSVPGELEKCTLCDKEAFRKVHENKETVIYKCRFGLTEAVSPLYNFGILTGYLMMGQISDDKNDTRVIMDKLVDIGIPKKDILALLSQLFSHYDFRIFGKSALDDHPKFDHYKPGIDYTSVILEMVDGTVEEINFKSASIANNIFVECIEKTEFLNEWFIPYSRFYF